MPSLLFRLIGALFLLCATPGCYLMHVGGGQLEILWEREPIEDVLARPDVAPEVAEKLRLVLDVRRYAIERIGLEESDSYTTYFDTGGGPVAYNVSASAPDSLTPYGWTFPLVGTIPYKGFFELEKARAEAAELQALGLDVLVLPVPAYSTLGWFDDPLYSSMIDYDEASLAEVLIHELTHATIYVASDADFNETLATFVGRQGAQDYFRARGGPEDPGLLEARREAEDEARYSAAVRTLRDELMRIYEASGPRSLKLALKGEAFARFRRRLADEVLPQLHDPERFGYALDPAARLDNAFVLMQQRYEGEEMQLFEAVHARLGRDLAATVRLLKALADEDDPRAALEQWLELTEPAVEAPPARSGR